MGPKPRPSRGRPNTPPPNTSSTAPGHSPAVSAQEPLRCGSRTIHATSTIDPALAERLRSGNVVHRDPDARDAANLSEDEGADNMTHQDVSRERGDDNNDDDYIQASGQRSLAAQPVDDIFAPPGDSTTRPLHTERFSTVERLTSGRVAASQRQIASPAPHAASPAGSLLTASPYEPAYPQDIFNLLRSPGLLQNLVHLAQGSGAAAHVSSPSQTVSGELSTAPVSHSLAPQLLHTSRKRISPATSETEKEEVARQKKAKHNAARPKHGDYGGNAVFAEVMRIASRALAIHFATVKPFPSKGARKKLIDDKYRLALEQCNVTLDIYPLTEEHETLLEKEETNMRSRIKSAIGNKICSYYGFCRIPSSDAERQANVTLVHQLLGSTDADRDARKTVFEYKNVTSKEDRFQHPIISDVLFEAFFKYNGALACTNQASFNPIPHQTLALILTGVEHCIGQYVSGTYDKHLKFSNNYFTSYDRHLNVLDQYTAIQWKQYRKLLFRNGLAYANVRKVDAPPPAIEIVASEDIEADMARLAADQLADFLDSSDVEPETA